MSIRGFALCIYLGRVVNARNVEPVPQTLHTQFDGGGDLFVLVVKYSDPALHGLLPRRGRLLERAPRCSRDVQVWECGAKGGQDDICGVPVVVKVSR